MSEVRVTNETTGGEKGRKPQRMELLPWAELMQVAELYAAGAEKYADHNWRRGFDWSLSFGAMMRHAALFWEGEEVDAETGCSHLTSVIFHASALLHFAQHHRALDDRPSTAMLRDEVERQEAIRAIEEAAQPGIPSIASVNVVVNDARQLDPEVAARVLADALAGY